MAEEAGASSTDSIGVTVPTTEAPTGQIAGAIQSTRPDATLIQKGDFGIVIYALLFVIALLLVFIFLDRMISRSVAKETAKSMEKVANALTTINVQISRIEGRIKYDP